MPPGFQAPMAPRLRVLHAIHDFLPRHQAGSEIYASDLATALQRRGHHVTVLAATYEPRRPHGSVVWRLFNGLPVVEVVNNWTFDGFGSAWAPPELDAVFGALLNTLDPDVLHCHSLLNLSLNLPALARARGAAVVGTLHDYTPVCPSGGQRIHKAEQHVCHTIDPDRCARCFRQSPFHAQMVFGRSLRRTGARGLAQFATALRRRAPALLDRFASVATRTSAASGPSTAEIAARLAAARESFTAFDALVAPSPSLAREFRDLGFPTGRLRVSANGLAPLHPAAPGATDGPLRVGYVGTIVWHKGVHVLLDAIGRLAPGRAEALVFGDTGTFPDYGADLRRRARGLPVRFMGRFEREARSAVYSQLDVVVVPSIWLENAPLVIQEAFMAGLPVVGARIGGIPDLIEDGVNGLLVEPGSAEDLARALDGLAQDRARLARLAAAAPPVKSVEEDAEQWEQSYLSLLPRGADRAAAS